MLCYVFVSWCLMYDCYELYVCMHVEYEQVYIRVVRLWMCVCMCVCMVCIYVCYVCMLCVSEMVGMYVGWLCMCVCCGCMYVMYVKR